jgi:hypothetical protein
MIIIGVEIVVGFEYAKAARKDGYLYPGIAYGFAESHDPLHPRTIQMTFYS